MNILAEILTFMLAGSLSLSGCGAGQKQEVSGAESVIESAVDYENTDISEWFYIPESGGETMDSLIIIDSVQHGTAGGSLKEAKTGAEFIKLTKAGDFEDVFKKYTDGMNALQLDFFSFQTDMAYRSAKAVFEDYENQKMLLSDAGVEDFNIEDYSEEKLDSLYVSIKEKLGSAGVSEEWKNHTDMEPFFMMD